MDNLINLIKRVLFGDKDDKIVSPIAEARQTTPTPTPNYEKAIRMGLKDYLGYEPPVATLSSDIVREAKKNNISPYIFPAVSVIETGGGTRQVKPNNPVNWAIYEPTFQPQTPIETIEKFSSGIGSGRANNPNFQMYNDFRRTGMIEDLASHYAPPNENDTKNWIDVVKEVIKRMKKYER
ncbi:MAG: hypothetical protein QXO70_01725 [Candidatus Pacearchaeota archaeon]